MVSDFYGKLVSPANDILINTAASLDKLSTLLPQNAVIYSPKINNGLFRVPWSLTEVKIKNFLKQRPDINWTVVEYERDKDR